MSVSTADFLSWTGGTAHGAVADSFEGATIDSRTAKPGCLYAALKGEKADGHDFAYKACAAGAAFSLVERTPPPGPDGKTPPHVIVKDVRRALADAARAYRLSLKWRVAGVTGSAGKTSTKELLAAFLRSAGKTASTPGNLNNDLGLPLSILNAPQDCSFGVFECGSNHPGEIAALADILRPDCAVVSSVGNAHIEHFKSLDGTAREKGSLFAAVPPSGFNVVSRENVRFGILKEMSKARLVETSLKDASAPFYARIVDSSSGRFEAVEADGTATILETGLPGDYNISNALLAFAAARTLGVPAAQCAAALDGFALPGRRWRTVERDGVTWIDDAYNANPDSMKAALGNFARIPCRGRRIAVLGDMFELGPRSAALHAETGNFAATLGLDIVVATGEKMSTAFAPAYHIAAPESMIISVPGVSSAAALMPGILKPGDCVLLKGSRGMAMEHIYEA